MYKRQVEMKEMDRVRRIIADHMVMSKKVSPHVTNVLEVDVTLSLIHIFARKLSMEI